jgi:hypothetical protein
MILSYLLGGVTGLTNACSFLPELIPLYYPYNCKNVYCPYLSFYITPIHVLTSNLEDGSSDGLIGFAQT